MAPNLQRIWPRTQFLLIDSTYVPYSFVPTPMKLCVPECRLKLRALLSTPVTASGEWRCRRTGEPTGQMPDWTRKSESTRGDAGGRPSNTSKEAGQGIPNARMELMRDSKSDSPVHTIVMPHDEPAFPPGPGRDEFVTACVVCHSPRYITMQPRFSRNTWLGEVNKMKDVYGAHISDEQVLRVTE